MTQRKIATLLFFAVAALSVAAAIYKYAVGASGTGLRFVMLAVISWTIARFGPWRG